MKNQKFFRQLFEEIANSKKSFILYLDFKEGSISESNVKRLQGVFNGYKNDSIMKVKRVFTGVELRMNSIPEVKNVLKAVSGLDNLNHSLYLSSETGEKFNEPWDEYDLMTKYGIKEVLIKFRKEILLEYPMSSTLKSKLKVKLDAKINQCLKKKKALVTK